MKPPVLIQVCNKYLWTLEPYAYLFNKYWGSDYPVCVGVYKTPEFQLPDNYSVIKLSDDEFPANRWGDGTLKLMNTFTYKHFIIMLEDYWACRKSDVAGIEILETLFDEEKNLLRVDLTNDRLYAGGMRDIGYFDRFDVVEASGSPYQMSLQAGIWDRDLFMDIISSMTGNERTPWDVELNGTTIVNSRNVRVFGTRQSLVRYNNVLRTGRKEIDLSGFTKEDRDYITPFVERGHHV